MKHWQVTRSSANALGALHLTVHMFGQCNGIHTAAQKWLHREGQHGTAQ